ncbi:MAG: hypothetical protein II973_04250 [Spirochaetaceae bacterium]|nr:hypothetical protein [Spirochaetaceae bacterium]
MGERMKKLFAFLGDILLILFFVTGAICLAHETFVNINLIMHHQEINAKIVEAKYRRFHRSYSWTVHFEYEDEGKIYIGKARFRWLVINRIKNLRNDKYKNGDYVIVLVDRFGNFQLKEQIRTELFASSLYLLLYIFCVIICTNSLFSKKLIKGKTSFYIQGKDLKIKRIKEVESISAYINMLKQAEIICFGIGNNETFVEYSYKEGNFIERKSNGKSETEKVIEDEASLAKALKSKLNGEKSQ